MSASESHMGTAVVALDGQERAELVRMLESALGDVRVEVHHTHTPDFRDQVKEREALLRRLIEKLRHPSA
jgi:hypothetical protein